MKSVTYWPTLSKFRGDPVKKTTLYVGQWLVTYGDCPPAVTELSKSVFASLTIEIAAAEILIVQLEKEVLTEVYTIL